MRFCKLIGVIFFLLFVGCIPQITKKSYVRTDLDPVRYHTFKLVTPQDGTLPPGMSVEDYNLIASSIRNEMMKRGFVETTNPHLFINIGLTVALKPKGGSELPKGAYPVFIAPRTDYLNTYSYSESELSDWLVPGKIVLDLIDLEDFRYILSLTTDAVLDSVNTDKRKETISELITGLIRDIKLKSTTYGNW